MIWQKKSYKNNFKKLSCINVVKLDTFEKII